MIHESASLNASYIQGQILADSYASHVPDPSQQPLVTQSRHDLTRTSDIVEHGSQLIRKLASDRQLQSGAARENGNEIFERSQDSFTAEDAPHPFAHLDHESESPSLPLSEAPTTSHRSSVRHDNKSESRDCDPNWIVTRKLRESGVEQQRLIHEHDHDEAMRTRTRHESDEVAERLPMQPFQQAMNESQDGEDDMQNNLEDTQMQLHTQGSELRVRIAGDSQYHRLDLASSLIGAGGDQEDDGLASPSQSQSGLPLYPESQRFKTPAHAGRKRSHDGKIINPPPTESRNPFAQHAGTPVPAGGLSQFFANTQAVSSPALPVPTSALRSDNLSPGLQLERRAQVSSPLEELRSVPRAWSEPQVAYLPLNNSQQRSSVPPDAIRTHFETQESLEVKIPFGSGIASRRHQGETERKARAAFESLSSPITATVKTVKIGRVHEPAFDPLVSHASSRSLPNSPSAVRMHCSTTATAPPHTDQDEDGDEEEDLGLETEVESFTDEANENERAEHNDLLGSLQIPNQVERPATIIPDTTRKAADFSGDMAPNTQPSPSIRQSRGRQPVGITPSAIAANIRIANSQRSGQAANEARFDPLKTSSGESVDIVPASPAIQLVATQPSDPEELEALANVEKTKDNSDHSKDISDIQRHHRLPKPPAERPHSIPAIALKVAAEPEQHSSAYGTAPLYPGHRPDEAVDSSQPIRNGRRKRKRMEEISQEDVVPLALESVESVDLAEILPPDADMDFTTVQGSVPDESPVRSRKRTKLAHGTTTPRLESSDTKATNLTTNTDGEVPEHQHSRITEDVDTSNALDSTSTANGSKSQLTPVRRPARHSAYDLGESPKPRHELKVAQSRSEHASYEVQHSAIQRMKGKAKVRAKRPSASVQISAEQENIPPHDKDAALATTDRTSATTNDATTVSTPTAQSGSLIAPQMVFAYYNDRGRAYYPAKCLQKGDDSKYTIKWPGYAQPEIMEQHKLCSLDLRAGDEVKVDLDGYPKTTYIIRELLKQDTRDENLTEVVTDVCGHTHTIVQAKVGQKVDKPRPIPIGNLYIMRNTFDRTLKRPQCFQGVSLVPDIATPGISTPSIRASTPTTPSSRSRKILKAEAVSIPIATDGIFTSMAFCLSYTSNETSLQQITKLLLENGGTILPTSFHDLVDDDMSVKARFENFGFAALLTDRHSRKPKYMEALAFGLPCLSGRWVEACIKVQKIVDWRDYLLPAGESAELEGAVRSRTNVLPEIGVSSLKEILRHRQQLFAHSTMIFVAGKGKSSDAHALHLSFVRVMGVEHIEKVADLAAAKEKLLDLSKSNVQNTIWLMVPDKDREAAKSVVKGMLKGTETVSKSNRRSSGKAVIDDGRNTAVHKLNAKVADKEFVMQSLIMGRLASRDGYDV